MTGDQKTPRCMRSRGLVHAAGARYAQSGYKKISQSPAPGQVACSATREWADPTPPNQDLLIALGVSCTPIQGGSVGTVIAGAILLCLFGDRFMAISRFKTRGGE